MEDSEERLEDSAVETVEDQAELHHPPLPDRTTPGRSTRECRRVGRQN